MERLSNLETELYARGLSGGREREERRRERRTTIARRYRDNTARANGYNSYLDLLKSRKERNMTISQLEKNATATREQRMGIAAKAGSAG